MSSSSSCCALPFSTSSVCLPPSAQRPDAAPARLLCAPAACTSGSLLCFVCFRCCWSWRCCCLLVLPLLPLLLPLSNSACSPQQQLFLFCFQREDRLRQARGFHQRVQLPTYTKKPSWYVAARLCALCFVSLCACALCVCAVRHYLLSHFHFGGEGLSPRTITCARAHAHSRALAASVSVRLPLPTATSV